MEKIDLDFKIEILPEHIIDQIKAGEVLERPAALLKELIENSLDANASEINIHLVENGLQLLSIEDNGHGMDFDNLPYAFLRHATSKLKTYDDLYRLKSFGFRGEALASLASSARITCITQPLKNDRPGGKMIIHGGVQELLIPYQLNDHGTSLFIKDLFYNTPARLKFIKSKTSEKSALKKILYAFILSNPQTYFSIKWDEKEKEIFKVATADNQQARVEQVFNSKEDLLHASETYLEYQVEVYFTKSTHTTPQYKHHYLFLNHRYFIDKSLHQTILRTLSPLWNSNENGHYLILIKAPTFEIDVNVHPNKTQIKFLKADIVYSLLVTSLKKALNQKNNIPVTELTNISSPHSFFSREENQALDLINKNLNHQDQNLSHSPIKNTPTPEIMGLISNQILLIKIEPNFFIADVKKIMAIFLTKSFQLFIENDETPSPLLISEPFKASSGKIDFHLEDLKNLGFEFDRLNVEVMALRTIPLFINQEISREIINCLIKFFLQENLHKYEAHLFKSFVEKNWPDSATISTPTLTNILKKIELDHLTPSLLVRLEDKNLLSILK